MLEVSGLSWFWQFNLCWQIRYNKTFFSIIMVCVGLIHNGERWLKIGQSGHIHDLKGIIYKGCLEAAQSMNDLFIKLNDSSDPTGLSTRHWTCWYLLHFILSFTCECIPAVARIKASVVTDSFCFVLALRVKSGSAVTEHSDGRSHLAVVACGPRLEETLTMLKSAVLFSKKHLHFYIFAEDELHDSFRNAVSILPGII